MDIYNISIDKQKITYSVAIIFQSFLPNAATQRQATTQQHREKWENTSVPDQNTAQTPRPE